MKLGFILSVSLFIAVSPRLRSHEYPDKVTVLGIGGTASFSVVDQADCPATVNVRVQNPQIATVTPSTGFGVKVDFVVTGVAAGQTFLIIDWQGKDWPLPGGCSEKNEVFVPVEVIDSELAFVFAALVEGVPQFRLSSPPGSRVDVEYSDDLREWHLMQSEISFGENLFEDRTSSAAQQRFYRASADLDGPGAEFTGNNFFFMGQVPPDFGPGTSLSVDINGDSVMDVTVQSDSTGFFTSTLSLPMGNSSVGMVFRDPGGESTPLIRTTIRRNSGINLANSFPQSLLNPVEFPGDPALCGCEECPLDQTGYGLGLSGFFGSSLTPQAHGVELISGKSRQEFPIVSFPTVSLNLDFSLRQSTLVDYSGPFGQGISHSFNMAIQRVNDREALIATPEMRTFKAVSVDGNQWFLPDGFFSQLQFDPLKSRWMLTHYSGYQVEFFAAPAGTPSYPISLSDPNGNQTRLRYDGSGRLQRIVTDAGQEQRLQYNTAGLLSSFEDHVQRRWTFEYDASQRLIAIQSPPVATANVPPGELLPEENVLQLMEMGPRRTVFRYEDNRFPTQMTSVLDPRGVVPMAWVYDAQGRVSSMIVNGNPSRIIYNPTDPPPLTPLDSGNLVTRFEDREGNVTDYEMHGRNGGSMEGAGRFGLRRKVVWTARGLGGAPLREDEPLYFEQRWLHDCDCLRPLAVSEPFSNVEASGFTEFFHGIPPEHPHHLFSYNEHRQVVMDQYVAGEENRIVRQFSYQPAGFGINGNFSRRLSEKEERSSDDHPLYQGKQFEKKFVYDARGNLRSETGPAITMGQTHEISHSYTYNDRGQIESHIDPNGNITRTTYYEPGPPVFGNMNSQGRYPYYKASETRGAPGSKDSAPALTTLFFVNPLGMVTRRVDPRGNAWQYEFNALQELTREIEPPIQLHNGQWVNYTTVYVYDRAGNRVLRQRSNMGPEGVALANPTVDETYAYDAKGNRLGVRREVSGQNGEDLITRFAYDKNDQLAVLQLPEGNRIFSLYDERNLLFKIFYGVSPGALPESGYPSSKTAETLAGATFVGREIHSYDARGNQVKRVDGRNNVSRWFYDFRNRNVAYADPNNNGFRKTYDDANNLLSETRGRMSDNGMDVAEAATRIYYRYDEAGRRYLSTRDADLSSSEELESDPTGSLNSSIQNRFDPGSRLIRQSDPNGNVTLFTYDAANRRIREADALNNAVEYGFDANSNLTQIREEEVDSIDPNIREIYLVRLERDPLNRLTVRRNLGRDGTSIDHAAFFEYDSRDNTVVIRDANGVITRQTYDDNDRLIRAERFDSDPRNGAANLLALSETDYDRNGRKTAVRGVPNLANREVVQTTRYVYDHGDRMIRLIFPDSDDPTDGSGHGPDGIWDRGEIAYDAINPIRVIDPRGVRFDRIYDAGNRLVSETIVRTGAVQGETRREFRHDSVNRSWLVQNDFVEIRRVFDSLSRVRSETSALNLAGAGFTSGWSDPIEALFDFDKQSNKTRAAVKKAAGFDLEVFQTFDPLNRVQQVRGAYFGQAARELSAFTYRGRTRVTGQRLGNGAGLRQSFDAKRRLAGVSWSSSDQQMLVGVSYEHEPMDNVTLQRFTHDSALADVFAYNRRYEVTAVDYRSGGATPSASPDAQFGFDAAFNRLTAQVRGPFDDSGRSQQYANNLANEYVAFSEAGGSFPFEHDGNGNPTRFPVRPEAGLEGAPMVNATAVYDAFDRLTSISSDVQAKQTFIYDGFGRRTAKLAGATPVPERRFVYDDWSVIEERIYPPGSGLETAQSRLERVYVNGPSIDHPILAAIDRNGDGALGGAQSKNVRNIEADQEYYFLLDRQGSVLALLDSENSERILEYYRYGLYGEPEVLPVLAGPDGLERTPADLLDNFSLNSGPRRSSAEFGNVYFYTGQRFDSQSGLYYYRHRYYHPDLGRFLQRDPIGFSGGGFPSLYAYVNNNPPNWVDPSGLRKVTMLFYHEELGAATALAGWLRWGDDYSSPSHILGMIDAALEKPIDPQGRCEDCLERIEILEHGGVGMIAIGGNMVSGNSASGTLGAMDPGMHMFFVTLRQYLCQPAVIIFNMCSAGKGRAGFVLLKQIADITGAITAAPLTSVSDEMGGPEYNDPTKYNKVYPSGMNGSDHDPKTTPVNVPNPPGGASGRCIPCGD